MVNGHVPQCHPALIGTSRCREYLQGTFHNAVCGVNIDRRFCWFVMYSHFGIVGIDYRQVSNIRRNLVGNKIVDHSDGVGASPVGAAPTTSSFSTPTPGFIGLCKDICKARRETFKFGDLVRLILKILRYVPYLVSDKFWAPRDSLTEFNTGKNVVFSHHGICRRAVEFKTLFTEKYLRSHHLPINLVFLVEILKTKTYVFF